MNYHGAEGLEFGGGNVNVDPSVAAVLPMGSRVISTDSHGVSFWVNTGRIDVELVDGTPQVFFIKVISNERGKDMTRGEFESMKALYSLAPGFAPKPIACGTYQTIPDTHFFLSEFRDMMDDTPDPYRFVERLAKIHLNSRSPNGKFGFHVTTYSGNLPQVTNWEDSWETFFTKTMRKALDFEIAVKGYDPEFEELVPALFDRVIPRLLRPLETEGRSVKPSLVHGDLWYANSGIDIDSGEPVIFDACCFYAHNEYEFGQWRPICNRFGDEYLAAYNTFVHISAPEEDFEGRLDLYRLRFDTHVSALFTENLTLRVQVLNVMRDLVQRYGHAGRTSVL
ncbi:Fructosamine kinase-domain-containing protein [Pseudomassariella vexata]|uniref:protein-ribulosamine 3-kinase n=1 Tax=Pseudomassariella vexata TaxID=1141098 RepID=A0A1Y2E425_9PEZI|nr:Fructosamine kinase-domain-containing protein [Pseudomassariella vexata]ORY66269.1 Fructosamine kinase-domain-containing protein [Pseudomassariella vexata]